MSQLTPIAFGNPEFSTTIWSHLNEWAMLNPMSLKMERKYLFHS